ncbi:TolC family protein [Candidatus Entotheonella palauensis]|uniref:TolC family protein n=1 Tax=Candidatus Entotheonella palauensis TaxID=93172 RepID=UPI000B7C8B04|nr:TolC family protein [Candidatus Entotheonella palauensis]
MNARRLPLSAGLKGRIPKAIYGVAILLALSGCATFDPQAGFSDVRDTVQTRSNLRVAWNQGTELDAQVAQEVRERLAKDLTADTAVQIALLNNRELQAMYASMGVAQADLVQAGLLENPVFDFEAIFPLAGGDPDMEFDIAMGFLNLFYMPLRQRVAGARFEAAKLQVTGAVLDFAATVRATFYRHQANAQMQELQQSITQGLTVALEVAQRLHDAGNITDLDLARQRATAEEARLQLATAEMAVAQSHEALNTLMGLWGEDTAWKVETRLPPLPDQPVSVTDVERLALQNSLDLASARQQMIVAGEQLGLTKAVALVPHAEIGAVAEHKEGEWEGVGPRIEFPIPLFDQGQAQVGRNAVELRQAQQAYYALAIRIRSTARTVRHRLQGARARVDFYRDIMLPLRERIVNETQLHYNAMQLGVFDLLQAQERQIQAAATYIESLLTYWLARTDLDHLLSGRLPSGGGTQVSLVRPTGSDNSGGH